MEFNEAIAIYIKHVEENEPGAQAPQPNAQLSELTNGVWYLRNMHGLLARVGISKKQVF